MNAGVGGRTGGGADSTTDPPPSVADGGPDGATRVVVLNPVSGDGAHRDRVHALAEDFGFRVVETEREGHAAELAREAAAGGAELLAAAGGDGTVRGVVEGVDRADALDRVTVGVVPTGTGNNFAGNVGVGDVRQAFDLLDSGERRRVDIGVADGALFVNSCICGVTAEASGETSSESKEQFGVWAYVATTLRLLAEYDGFDLAIRGRDGDPLWDGRALLALVGNARRFGVERRTRANLEDGLLDVAVVESMPARAALEEAAVYRLFGEESDHVTRLAAPELDIDVGERDPIEFSLDGELSTHGRLSVSVRPRALDLCVGPGYEPAPEG